MLHIITGSVADPDPHHFRELDPHPQKSEKPDPHESRKLNPDPHHSHKFQSYEGSIWSHGGPWTLSVAAPRLKKIKLLRVCKPVEADSHHFD
jgi:hypothetical protein